MESIQGLAGFGQLLRELRIKAEKSMGQVARHLGISVVYYSEVEAGKKPAFPFGKVDFTELANVLEASVNQLKSAAEEDRDRRQFSKIFGVEDKALGLAVQFGRRLSDNDLSDEQIAKIQKILNGGE